MEKLKIVVFSVFFILIFNACKDENRFRIPDVSVYMDLDLLTSFPTFRNSVNDTLIFTKPRYGYPLDRTGFGGILVYTDFEGKYQAWDLCCPYEVNPAIRIYPQPDGTALCKACGSKFQILTATGLPMKGSVSRWILKKYSTQLRNDHLYITR